MKLNAVNAVTLSPTTPPPQKKKRKKKLSNSLDLIVHSPLYLLHISFMNIKNFNRISLSILITRLLDDVWILKGEVTC